MYEVSNLGRVRSWNPHAGRATPHVLQGGLNTRGYRHFVLVDSTVGRRTTRTAHSLVAEVWLGPRPIGAHVCHNDGDKTNNTLGNLRYDSPRANVADQLAAGTHISQEQRSRTHCPHGHPYDDANTYWYTNKQGYTVRYCRTCNRLKCARQSKRRAEARNQAA